MEKLAISSTSCISILGQDGDIVILPSIQFFHGFLQIMRVKIWICQTQKHFASLKNLWAAKHPRGKKSLGKGILS